LTPLSQSSGTVELEIGAWVEMAFLRPLTASLTLHPAHVVPMAESSGLKRGIAPM
jgi:hypothetical protein